MDTNSVKNLLGEQPVSSTDIPIEHLDYDYIGECSKVKELEKILKVLRSGAEGYYPDLIQFCEERIAKLNPNSRVLRQDKAPASKYDLPSEEWSQVNADIKDWTNDITHSDKTLNSKQSGAEIIPPVRQGATIDTKGKKQKENTDQAWGKPSKDRIKSSEYRKWDKYDVDAETKKVDGVDDKGQRLKEAATEISSSRSAGKTPDIINVDGMGMSDRDREVIANREKDKGNEAFRSSDFEEAVTYYSRSISVIPSAPAYNNRALARIKLGHFQAASDDCTKVLELEPDNIKAFLRRGTSRKSLKEYDLARLDLEKVLSIEPHNKQAKDLLADIEAKELKAKKEQENCKKEKASQNGSPISKGGRRLVIEEVEGSEESDEEWADAKQEVTKDQGPNLVNGVMDHGSKTEEEEKFESPMSNGEAEVVRNIPFEESVSSDERTADVIDGSRVSRPAKDNVSSNQENGLNAAEAKKASKSGEVTNADRGQHHSASEPASNPPPAPRKEKPLPPAVVSMKDKALTLYKAGQYSEARDGFTQAIDRLLPGKEDFGSALVSLYSNRASCNHKIGDSASCVKDCNASLELNPYSAKVLVKRAAANEAIEKYRHAYVDYQQALALDPFNNVAQASSSRLIRLLKDEDGSNWRDRLPPRSTILSLPQRPPISTMAPSNAPICANTSTTKATMTTMNAGQQAKGQQDKGQEVKSQQDKDLKVEGQDNKDPKVKGQDNKDSKLKGQDNKDNSQQDKGHVANGQNLKSEPPKDAGTEKKRTEPVLTKEERFQKLKNEGNAFFKKGVHNEAVRCYTACIETDPTQVASYTNRALCFLKLSQFQKAEVDCSMALALEKNNIKALYRRALANKGLKEYKKSLQDFTTLLKVDPENKDAKKELDLVKDLWRKELMASKTTGKPSEKSQSKVKPTRIQIEEDDEDSDEKEDSDKKPTGTKSTKKTSNKPDKPTTTKDNQESTKQAGSKKASRNSQSKPAANTVPKLSKISAYEFMQAWMSLKGSRNLAGYADIIRQVPPKELPKVLTNKLDGDMLGIIVRATSEVLSENDPSLGYAVLSHLIDVDRFNTLVLFLSGKDKKSLRRALDHLESVKCEAYTADDVKKLRKNYAL